MGRNLGVCLYIALVGALEDCTPGIYALSIDLVDLMSVGTGTSYRDGKRASASAKARADAVPKRCSGFFSRQHRIILETTGDMAGLIRIGGLGEAWLCCNIIADELLP